MRCLSKITDTQGNEFNLMQINDFSVITSTIKGYTSPTTTNIWQAGSHTPPSWMSAQGDLLCKVNTSTVAQLQENKMVDNDYLLFKYGRVIQGSDNFYGMGFYNNKNSAVRLDTFGDGPSIGNQTVDCYLGIVLDDDNQRAYILACTDKYNDPSNNKFRIWALAGKYNGTDLYWETFGEVILNQSAGGGGLYGGYVGGAGSGYIGNSLVSNKKMVGFNVPTSSAESTKTESVNEASADPVSGKPKIGNGFARIKFLRALRTMTIPTDLSNYETLSLDITSHDNPFPYTYADGNMLFWGKRNKKPLLYDSTGKYYYFAEGSSDTATRFAIPLEKHRCINISLKAGCWNAPTEYTTLYIYLVNTQLEVMSDINWMNYNNPELEQNLPWQSYANFSFDFNSINADYILFGYGEGSIRFKDLVITYYE